MPKEYDAIREAIAHVNRKGIATCPYCGSDTFSVYHIALTATVRTTDNKIMELNDRNFCRICCTLCGMEINIPLPEKKKGKRLVEERSPLD